MKGAIGSLVVVMVLVVPQAAAQCSSCDSCVTTVGGPIFADTVWTAAGSPYCVTQSVVVGNRATLTIEPGVEVRFKHGLGLSVGYSGFGVGTLVARGTADLPICFTTNDPCEATPDPADPGDWARVLFDNDAEDAEFDANGDYVAGCILEYVNVEYSGGAGPAVTATNASPYVANCDVHDNAGHGIKIDATDAGTVRIESCHVHHHAAGRGIVITSSASWPVRIEGCEIDHCTHTNWAGGGLSLGSGTGHLVVNNFIHDCSVSGDGSDHTGGGVYINARTTVKGNTVTNNGAYSGKWYTVYGGGIMLDGESDGSIVQDNIVIGNQADSYYAANGGGICVWNSGNCTMTGNTVTDNWADGWGGGIRIQGSANSTVRENTVSGNNNGWSTDWKGGGIAIRDSANCLIEENSITENTTTAQNADGAGLYLYNSSTGTGEGKGIRRNIIARNSASGSAADGAGIYLESSGYSKIELNEIRDNSSSGASVDGTGIALVNSGDSIIRSNVVTGNRGSGVESDGAGIAVVNGSCVVESNFVAGNWCTDEGAGLFFWNCNPATLTCNAVVGNTAGDDGGAIYLGDSDNCTLRMCRIVDNESTNSVTGGIFAYECLNLDLSGGLASPGDYNTLSGNSGYSFYNDNSTGHNVAAQNVRWCTLDTGEIDACIFDYFDDASRGVVFYYPPLAGTRGDLNGDGVLDLFDIDPFTIVLTSKPLFEGYYAAFPCGDHTLADCNEDGVVDLFDIDPFVILLTAP